MSSASGRPTSVRISGVIEALATVMAHYGMTRRALIQQFLDDGAARMIVQLAVTNPAIYGEVVHALLTETDLTKDAIDQMVQQGIHVAGLMAVTDTAVRQTTPHPAGDPGMSAITSVVADAEMFEEW